jgi:hypothetical protein
VLRLAACLVMLVCYLLAAACSDDDNGNGSAATPASTAEQEATIFPASENGESQVLSSIACEGDELTIVTTSRTVRAVLACDRFPPADVIERFTEEPTEVEVRPVTGKILLRATAAGSLEFTVENVRIEER